MAYSVNSIKNVSVDVASADPSAMLAEGVKGCCIGISVQTNTEFGPSGAHEDQEGFIVASGTGEANLDGDIVPVEVGTVMILQPGVKHTFRSYSATEPLMVYWFHAAV